jgi:hypothetical protein
MNSDVAKAARREVRSAVGAATLGEVWTTGVKGTAQKCCHRVIPAKNRLRRAGAGQHVLSHEVGHEVRQRLAAYLVQPCKKYVNHPDHGSARRDAVLQRIAKYRKKKTKWVPNNGTAEILAGAESIRIHCGHTGEVCGRQTKSIQRSLLWPWHGNSTMDVFLTRPSLQKRCVFDSIKFSMQDAGVHGSLCGAALWHTTVVEEWSTGRRGMI